MQKETLWKVFLPKQFAATFDIEFFKKFNGKLFHTQMEKGMLIPNYYYRVCKKRMVQFSEALTWLQYIERDMSFTT